MDRSTTPPATRQRHRRPGRAVRRHDRRHRHPRPAARRHPGHRHDGLRHRRSSSPSPMVVAVTLLPACSASPATGSTAVDRPPVATGQPTRPHTDARPARGPTTSAGSPWRYASAACVVLVASPSRCSHPHRHRRRRQRGRRRPPQRSAYDLLADGFGPGFNGPLTVVVESTAGDPPAAGAASATPCAADPGVARRRPAHRQPGGDTAVHHASSRPPRPQDEATAQLVDTPPRRRAARPPSTAPGPTTYVTGADGRR